VFCAKVPEQQNPKSEYRNPNQTAGKSTRIEKAKPGLFEMF
jgi:hypothetical protein